MYDVLIQWHHFNCQFPSFLWQSSQPVNQILNQSPNRRDTETPFNAPTASAPINASSSSVSTQNYGQSSSQVLFNWQASKATLKERMSAIFNREVLADVHFLVGKGPQQLRTPAHKFVLSIGSAVFDAMFNGAMADANSDEIPLPDVEPAAFLALLRFLYTDEIQIGPETVMTTLYVAKKYAVPALERGCVDFLKQNLSSDNAFMLLTQVLENFRSFDTFIRYYKRILYQM